MVAIYEQEKRVCQTKVELWATADDGEDKECDKVVARATRFMTSLAKEYASGQIEFEALCSERGERMRK